MKVHEDILKRHGYTVQASLGKGGQYYAYRAHEADHGLCAVRVFRDLIEDQNALPKSVTDELQLAEDMRSSPYFATLFKWFIEDNWLFTVWDYAESGTLATRVDSHNPLNRQQCCKYLENVAMGLDELHQRPAVHGDIKPDNLLIYRNEFVKIGDLGIARLLTSATTRKTRMGSDEYWLPTQHAPAPTRERDLFAFAVTYVELRLGRHPYGDDHQTRYKNLCDNLPNLHGLDRDEKHIVLTLLMQKKSALKGTLVEWIGRIQTLPAESQPADSESTRQSSARTKARKRLPPPAAEIRTADSTPVPTTVTKRAGSPAVSGTEDPSASGLTNRRNDVDSRSAPEASVDKTAIAISALIDVSLPAASEPSATTTGSRSAATKVARPLTSKSASPNQVSHTKSKVQANSTLFRIIIDMLILLLFMGGWVAFWCWIVWYNLRTLFVDGSIDSTVIAIFVILFGVFVIASPVYAAWFDDQKLFWRNIVPYLCFLGIFGSTPYFANWHPTLLSQMLFSSPAATPLSDGEFLLHGITDRWYPTQFQAVSFSEDGKNVIAVGPDCMYSWDVSTHEEVGRTHLGAGIREDVMDVRKLVSVFMADSLVGSQVIIGIVRLGAGDGYRSINYQPKSAGFGEEPDLSNIETRLLDLPVAYSSRSVLCYPDAPDRINAGFRLVDRSTLALTGKIETPYHQFGGQLSGPVISQDGSSVALICQKETATDDNGQSIARGDFRRDPATGELLREKREEDRLKARLHREWSVLVFDGITGQLRGTIKLHEAVGRAAGYEGRDYKWSFENPATFSKIMLSPNGNLAAVRNGSAISVFATATMSKRSEFDCRTGSEMVCFSSDGAFLAIQQVPATDPGDGTKVAATTQTLQIVESANGNVVWEFSGPCQRARFGGVNDEFIAGIADPASIVLIKWRN